MELYLNINPRGKLVEEDRTLFQGILSKYLHTSQGRQKLAQSMANPIRRNLDYQGIARKLFPIQQLPDGASLIYDKDDDE